MDIIKLHYDRMLIGCAPAMEASDFFGSKPGGANERRALTLLHYALEDILLWTPEDAIQRFDYYIVRAMKLERIIAYIDYPTHIPNGHPRYILSLLYPGLVRIDERKMTEEIFRSVLDASTSNPTRSENERVRQFPREFFAGVDGFRRYCYCVKYLLDNYYPLRTIRDVYAFLDSSDGRKILHAFRLKVPAEQFAIDLLKVAHHITKNDSDSELYYSYFVFCRKRKEFNK